MVTTRPFIRTVTEIRAEWLLELSENYYDLATFPDGEARHALRHLLKKQKAKNKAARSDKDKSSKKKVKAS